MTAKQADGGGSAAARRKKRRPVRRRPSLPGDLSRRARLHRMLRVDQAGELGAKHIYRGQLAVLAEHECEPALRDMAEQEEEHLETFDRLLSDRGVRPSALSPLWRAAGFTLGAGTALLGERAAMACTVAVEEVIEEHYQRQLDELADDEAELRALVERFRDDEIEHRDIGLAHGAEAAPAYQLLNHGIKAGTRLAIWLAERI
ncbi:MAG: demethoxyubiquinone hydroxylase family protein [Alphaproteobacteria bacterium]|jgi:ubiquinone biosynthesis monooxygenase Coq7|nr:demethoxyubiquinone hydroxylase family protein [Alphaproteobacteria bacterium]MDP6567113.1 demethoxyubiquinone hydroxylase family protein [Alphaproteobacteria bacterium]MDP6813139.1 demethoxyubiquinone hydroxylase family protein [Alphaproteobacteria bacterium]